MKDRLINSNDLEGTISELKEKLRDEKGKNSFINAILEGGTLIIWAVDTHLELISFNQNYFNFFLHKNPKSRVGYEKNGEIKTASSAKFWQQKYKIALTGRTHNFEIRMEVGDNEVWKEVFLNPIYDTDGEITGVSGLAYDITEKMYSRLALIKSEEKFRNIFESFQDLYFRCDFNGKLTMLSPSVRDIMGYSEKELLGKNITNFYLYNIQTKFLLRQLAKLKRVRNFEAGIVHKSGEIIPCICNVRIIQDDKGKLMHVEGVARDITELKRTNEELQRSKDLAEKSLKIKERFLANMSHEIRTPLNGIMGMLHLLDETKLDDHQKKHVRALKSSSDILLNILNDLLDLSKIEAGKMELKNSEVSTGEVFEKLALLYKQQAQDNDIRLIFKTKKGVPQYILIDETKLIQVYSNLISNAIKFTPSGGTVTAGIMLDERFDEKVVLKGYVKDTGIGISNTDKDKLFTSFTQLDSSNSKSYKGTGLGLYISKKIVKLFNGRIGVKSEENKGSKFWFTFETKPVAKAEKKAESAKEGVTLSHSPHVLIVDDNKVNLDLASEMLKNAGCRVAIASSGQQAIDLSVSTCYDLILMDIQMPDMDGIETATHIRKRCKEATPPIIAMTAYSMHGDDQKFLQAGMDDYIAKPIKPTVLIEKVEQWTGHDWHEQKHHEKEISTAHHTINEDTLNLLIKYAGEEAVAEALGEFNEECEMQIKNCTELFPEKKFKEILDILHTLKGNASTLGIEKLAFKAETMESDIKEQKYCNFERDLDILVSLYRSYIKEAKRFDKLKL
ncbi:sensor histidine kinase/response regulator fusion protein [Fulvivirga imtechensis AK7]|uniref:histidine kinase n=1 Tax=Fulvivirga imtechensis AK7 TaxID=1237149 RepID=L8JU81_9BACT|nr:response regulator [Fulvivirga imtechensis]ELR72330.1 sensor histidine kinase/response regulator fusion protein [Fulvivirga imtechensis AK7]